MQATPVCTLLTYVRPCPHWLIRFTVYPHWSAAACEVLCEQPTIEFFLVPHLTCDHISLRLHTCPYPLQIFNTLPTSAPTSTHNQPKHPPITKKGMPPPPAYPKTTNQINLPPVSQVHYGTRHEPEKRPDRPRERNPRLRLALLQRETQGPPPLPPLFYLTSHSTTY
jgi:hypothetical protein